MDPRLQKLLHRNYCHGNTSCCSSASLIRRTTAQNAAQNGYRKRVLFHTRAYYNIPSPVKQRPPKNFTQKIWRNAIPPCLRRHSV
ncbi:hypothetical protein HMPREF0908_0614 [Selenomonas flueggei ATCC 43531]|uniref:Uncharacterized protein n=1 Tax=Selenomonas flueggei ATCC 43531 TaxID=638302 RepID=C4V270_9FIRM|nr:hypothetical protein HMPREF0908_0614 [Selenomonas flueggei ATCC 43531]